MGLSEKAGEHQNNPDSLLTRAGGGLLQRPLRARMSVGYGDLSCVSQDGITPGPLLGLCGQKDSSFGPPTGESVANRASGRERALRSVDFLLHGLRNRGKNV